MSRSALYLIIGILIAAVIGIGAYLIYQEQNRPGLQIEVDDTGISIEGSG